MSNEIHEQPWYKNAVFYEINVRSFYDSNGDGIGDLAGLTEKFDYIVDLGVDCIWLMPIYPSPLADDGYDIADFYNIHPDLGTLQDFRSLIDIAHASRIKVIVDLVLNHTSDQHHWFQEARTNPASAYHDYYVWSDNNNKYADARIIFLDYESSNWHWDPIAQKYYWHRFFSSQPDLNYNNPAVQEEMLNVVRFWLDLGVDGFRADAVPYLFEREGTNCENLPETHLYLKRLRKFVDEYRPGTLLLCEANQWPEDLRPYFGDGDEFLVGFHFPLMPRLFMALESGDFTKVKEIMERTPVIPENCSWCTFLRNHDELTLEMVTEEEREWMWERYAPENRMRLNLGIRRRLAPLLGNDYKRIALANSLLFTLPGVPIIYYGDEIGMGDNIYLADRNGVRTPMQWADKVNAGFSSATPSQLFHPIVDDASFPLRLVNVETQQKDPDSLLQKIRHMIAVRKRSITLGEGEFELVDTKGNESVAAYLRVHPDQIVLVLNNLIGQAQQITVPVEGHLARNLLGNEKYPIQDGRLDIYLSPFDFFWLEIISD